MAWNPQINAEAFNVKRCESISDFRELEETLETDEEYRKNLVAYVKTIGGADARDNIRRIMTRLLSNMCMSHMNMKGTGGRVAFELSRTCSIIINAVKGARGGTEADLLNVMARVLKYAPDRKGGAGRQTQKE